MNDSEKWSESNQDLLSVIQINSCELCLSANMAIINTVNDS